MLTNFFPIFSENMSKLFVNSKPLDMRVTQNFFYLQNFKCLLLKNGISAVLLSIPCSI